MDPKISILNILSNFEEFSKQVSSMILTNRANLDEKYSKLNEILYEANINPQEFPGAIQNFWSEMREYHKYLFLGLENQIKHPIMAMLTFMKAAIYSKEAVNNYIISLIQCLEEMLKNNYGLQYFKGELLIITNYMRSFDDFYSLPEDQAFKICDNSLYEDSFMVYLSYICINRYHIHAKPSQARIEDLLNSLYVFKNETLDYLITNDLEPQSKIITRCFCLDLFKNGVCGFNELTIIIEELKTHPMRLVPANRMDVFDDITYSSVLCDAISQFAQQTIEIGNAPFQIVDDALTMFAFAFAHMIDKKKIFFSDIFGEALGLTVYEYIFINKALAYDFTYNNAFLLITLLHESIHLYKRISPTGLVHTFSPSSTIFSKGSLVNKAEDGERFENILFPGFTDTIYLKTAEMLLDLSSWNQSLENFTNQFKALQNEAEQADEIGFRRKRKRGALG